MATHLSLLRRSAGSAGNSHPFYLLSAVLMTVGCYTLSHSLDLEVAAVRKLVILIAVVNVYEAALIGLAIYLVVSRRLVRDGSLLLILELPFLLDAIFLNAELVAAVDSMGGLVAGVQAAL